MRSFDAFRWVFPDSRSLVAGLLVVAIGLVTVVEGLSYDLGTARTLGPGAVPVALGAMLVVLGVVLAATPDRAAREAADGMNLRAGAAILASVVVFAATVNRFGLLPASLLLVLVSGLADQNVRLLRLVILAVCASVVVVGVFVYALGMPLRVFRLP